jgi:hypothetical protein
MTTMAGMRAGAHRTRHVCVDPVAFVAAQVNGFGKLGFVGDGFLLSGSDLDSRPHAIAARTSFISQ